MRHAESVSNPEPGSHLDSAARAERDRRENTAIATGTRGDTAGARSLTRDERENMVKELGVGARVCMSIGGLIVDFLRK